ncbi:hypothetical protein BaRGS_00033934 [Batillaria attramentaria]|uniref:Uncharacterized protein n=1 Tax=Batillaria attramentaria TaxID=370345 RepID=A0ABD0JIM8_9CAEN
MMAHSERHKMLVRSLTASRLHRLVGNGEGAVLYAVHQLHLTRAADGVHVYRHSQIYGGLPRRKTKRRFSPGFYSHGRPGYCVSSDADYRDYSSEHLGHAGLTATRSPFRSLAPAPITYRPASHVH